MTTLIDMIEAYIKYVEAAAESNNTGIKLKYKGKLGSITKLLAGKSKHALVKTVEKARTNSERDQITAGTIERGMTDSVKSYPKSKQEAINIYNDFAIFIKDKYGVEISLSFNEWFPKNSIERQIHITKLLHDKNTVIADLPQLVMVNEKTIEKDLKKLRGEDGDPIEVMGQKLIVDFNRSCGKVTFPSTVHPLFLTFNLTQVITMMEGLKNMADEKKYREYALYAAATIWAQLSEYAKNRILGFSGNLGIDGDWYQSIENKTDSVFYTETECSSKMGAGNLLYIFKNGDTCYIEYLTEKKETVIYGECKIKNMNDAGVLIRTKGEEILLSECRIVKTALSMIELFKD